MAVRLVKIVNNTNTNLGITLNDGDHIELTQYIKGKANHISKAVDYDLLPVPVVKKGGMLARGMVSVIEAG